MYGFSVAVKKPRDNRIHHAPLLQPLRRVNALPRCIITVNQHYYSPYGALTRYILPLINTITALTAR